MLLEKSIDRYAQKTTAIDFSNFSCYLIIGRDEGEKTHHFKSSRLLKILARKTQHSNNNFKVLTSNQLKNPLPVLNLSLENLTPHN